MDTSVVELLRYHGHCQLLEWLNHQCRLKVACKNQHEVAVNRSQVWNVQLLRQASITAADSRRQGHNAPIGQSFQAVTLSHRQVCDVYSERGTLLLASQLREVEWSSAGTEARHCLHPDRKQLCRRESIETTGLGTLRQHVGLDVS